MKKYLLSLFAFLFFTSSIFADKVLVDFQNYYKENPHGVISLKVDGMSSPFSPYETEIDFNFQVSFRVGDSVANISADGFKISLVKENGKWVFQVDYIKK